MTIYAGLVVSDKATHICVVDGEGVVVRRDVVASDPDVLARWLERHCPSLARVVLETGALSSFLYHRLSKAGDPLLRSALYEVANSILARLKGPCALQSWAASSPRPRAANARVSPSPASSPRCSTI